MKTVLIHDGIVSEIVGNEHLEIIDASKLDIKPCYNCGQCQSSGTGICAHKDDIGSVLYALAHGQRMLLVCKAYYGTYSPAIKKVLDKLMLLGGNPFLRIHKQKIAHVSGELPIKEWNVIWYSDQYTKEEEAILNRLVYENADITNMEQYASSLVHTNDWMETLRNQVKEVSL